MAEITWEWPHTKKWPKFSGGNIDVLKKMFLAGEALNVNNFIKFYTDPCYYKFGNFPAVENPQMIAETSQGFIDACEGLHHHIVDIWEMPDGTVICKMEVTYVGHDGRVVTLPCCDTIKFEDGKVKELRIYMDIGPLFGPDKVAKSFV
jgi:hypothetical protein